MLYTKTVEPVTLGLLKRLMADTTLNQFNLVGGTALFHTYKSLTWFEDAELDAELEIFNKKYSWAKVKKTIIKAVENAI